MLEDKQGLTEIKDNFKLKINNFKQKIKNNYWF